MPVQNVDCHIEFEKLQDENDFETEKHCLRKNGIPDDTVTLPSTFAHNKASELKTYCTMILKDKVDVRNQAFNANIDYRAFINEANDLVQDNILWAVWRAFSYIRKTCKTKQHVKNYFRSAMRSFYETAVDAYAQEKTELIL